MYTVSVLCVAHTAADNDATEAYLDPPSSPPFSKNRFSVINRNYMHMSMMFSPIRPLAVGGLYVVIVQWERADNKTILYLYMDNTHTLYVLAFFPRLRVPRWRTCVLIDIKNINIKNI